VPIWRSSSTSRGRNRRYEVFERLRVAPGVLRVDARRDALSDPLLQAAITTPEAAPDVRSDHS
jgi:hypothetical protein